MNSKSKYASTRKHRAPGWPRGREANQLKGYLGALGCGTSQLSTFEQLHELSMVVFAVPRDADHKVTAQQVGALGAKERKRRAAAFLGKLEEPNALWPEISRGRGTLVGLDSKAQAKAKLQLRRKAAPADLNERVPFKWPATLRYLRAWMVEMGFDPTTDYTENEIMMLCWDVHQSRFNNVGPRVERPTTLSALQRRLTGEGKKYRLRDRNLAATYEYRLGTFGPASGVRRVYP